MQNNLNRITGAVSRFIALLEHDARNPLGAPERLLQAT